MLKDGNVRRNLSEISWKNDETDRLTSIIEVEHHLTYQQGISAGVVKYLKAIWGNKRVGKVDIVIF